MVGQVATALGKGGGLWLMGGQCWGRVGVQVWSLAASHLQRSSSPIQLSSVPTLLSSSSAQVGPQYLMGLQGSGTHRSGWENGNTVLF